MFTCYKSDIQLTHGRFRNELHTNYVSRSGNSVFFIVNGRYDFDFIALAREVVFIDRVSQLLPMLEPDHAYIAHNVYIATPAHINGTHELKIELLHKISTADEPEPGIKQQAYVYHVESGQRYVDSYFETRLEYLSNIQTLYDLNPKRRTTS